MYSNYMHIWFICIGGYSSFKTRVSFFHIYLGSSFWFKAKFRGVLERVLLKERRAPWRSEEYMALYEELWKNGGWWIEIFVEIGEDSHFD